MAILPLRMSTNATFCIDKLDFATTKLYFAVHSVNVAYVAIYLQVHGGVQPQNI